MNITIPEPELKITRERVLEASSKCTTAAAALKTLFPEAFEDEAFKFAGPSGKHTLDASTSNGPLCIGFSLAPDGLSGKCLLVDSHYEMKQQVHGRYTVLTFYRRK